MHAPELSSSLKDSVHNKKTHSKKDKANTSSIDTSLIDGHIPSVFRAVSCLPDYSNPLTRAAIEKLGPFRYEINLAEF